MLSFLNDIPLYCPSCGTPTRLEQGGYYQLAFFKEHKNLNCATCRAIYQLAYRTDILRAAVANGRGKVGHIVGDGEQEESENGMSING